MVNKLKTIAGEVWVAILRIILIFLIGYFFTLGAIAAFTWSGFDVAIAHYDSSEKSE